ncbi:hypothetical protein CDAR_393521 [Caerostris darwini]|uniref:Uncharacterized protein n=1 Tax=Caerostris darwini TaxID=1538125 RepID=A0AAV4W789_9ARAC|nr:hypothetical protein CDAR_393521 [Caerostris darwini]
MTVLTQFGYSTCNPTGEIANHDRPLTSPPPPPSILLSASLWRPLDSIKPNRDGHSLPKISLQVVIATHGGTQSGAGESATGSEARGGNCLLRGEGRGLMQADRGGKFSAKLAANTWKGLKRNPIRCH